MTSFISIVTPTFNEEECIGELIDAVHQLMSGLCQEYEHIIIDNCSTDKTVEQVKLKCMESERVKLIVNSRNFGQIISPVAGLFAAKGDAVIILAADFENPPEVMPLMIEKWQNTGLPVFGAISESNESGVMKVTRATFYSIVSLLSTEENVQNFNGYCLIPRNIIECLKETGTLYLFLRHELVKYSSGYEIVTYTKTKRAAGTSKNNFFTLVHIAMVGFIANKINLSRLLFKWALVFNIVLGLLNFMVGGLNPIMLAAVITVNISFAVVNQYYLSELAYYKKNQRESTLVYKVKERCNLS